MPDQIAIISDVHGNVTALEAVLADIATRGITRIINLGDVIGKGPRGSEAIRLTRQACEVTLRGNWDSLITQEAALRFEIGQWTRASLSDDDLAWLAALPSTFELVMSGRRIRLFHASPVSEFVRVRLRHTPEEFRGMFTNTDFTGPFLAAGQSAGATPDVVGYGDIHAAYLELRDGLTLFNVGATGNPLDDRCAPYVVLEGAADSLDPAPFSVRFARVPYDIEAEIRVARALGMPEADAYAAELRDGIYRGARTKIS
jgi:predicted phosphodiesterase